MDKFRMSIPTGQLPLRPELLRAQQQQHEQQQRLPQPVQVSQPQMPIHQQQQQYRWQAPPMNQQGPSPGYPPMPTANPVNPPFQPSFQMEDVRQQPRSPPQTFMPVDIPPHLKTLPFPGPPPGVESTVRHLWKDRVMTLDPRPLIYPDALENINSKSVGFLCNLGKDVIQELIIRTFALNTQFKGATERFSSSIHGNDIDVLLLYCRFLLGKLWQIRCFIDRKMRRVERINADEFIELMCASSDPVVPDKIAELRSKFMGNQKHLIELSNDLKESEWLSENTDPRNRENFVRKLTDIAISEEVRAKMREGASKKE